MNILKIYSFATMGNEISVKWVFHLESVVKRRFYVEI